MMNLRKTSLPPGWYPQNRVKIEDFLEKFINVMEKTSQSGSGDRTNNKIIGAVAPHAGWYYSGKLAAQAVSALTSPSNQSETVVVIGGHLPLGMPALFAMEEAVFTPLGALEIDLRLREAIMNSFIGIPGLKTAEDRYHDNTVEILLPMVKYFFPEAKLIWLRLPADIRSFEAGKTLARTAAALNRQIIVLGSTDLTHYGSNYGFSPKGYGKEALAWVKTENDKRFINAVESGDSTLVLERAEKEHSSCSAGAVLGVMGFASETRAEKTPKMDSSAGKLLGYSTSADVIMDEEELLPNSFVGYGAFIWDSPE